MQNVFGDRIGNLPLTDRGTAQPTDGCHRAYLSDSTGNGAPTAGFQDGKRYARVIQRLPDGETDCSGRGHLRVRREGGDGLPGGGLPNQAREPAAPAAARPGVQTRN